MNTHSTINNPVRTQTNTDAGSHLAAALLDENVIRQMANEFFSMLPGLASNSSAEYIAPITPAHAPQAAEPLTALSTRAPNTAYQKSLQPDYPEHIPNMPDDPERRMVSSAPVIGGAKLPTPPYEPHFPQLRDELPRQYIPQKPQNGRSTTETGFYFLDPEKLGSPHNFQHNELQLDHLQQVNTTGPQLLSEQELKQLLTEEQSSNLPTADGQTAFYFTQPPVIEPKITSTCDTQKPVQQAPVQFKYDTTPGFDPELLRRDFPILQERINGYPLVWFDNAATTQKPKSVIERIGYFYQHENSNIHRAAHTLAARSTDAFEHSRRVVAHFIGAESANEIIFVRGATEGINLIAKTWGIQNITAGDEILISQLEHHANIVPWYQLSQQTGAKLRVIPVDDSGQIMLQHLPNLLTNRTKLLAITQVSNALGTITPTAEIIEMAHSKGVRVLVDAAQSVSHMQSDVRTLDADFFVFSGHKVFAPTGIGVVYAKPELLESMPVWQGGGNMIEDVSFEHIVYQSAPNKFEAGTANIADAVGLAAALEYVQSIGIHNISRYEHQLLEYAEYGLLSIPGLRLIGTAKDKASVMSFTLQGYRTEQVGKILNQYGIAVRSGHHCAQPILRRFGVESTVRPSLAFYNTTEEIDHMIRVLHQLRST